MEERIGSTLFTLITGYNIHISTAENRTLDLNRQVKFLKYQYNDILTFLENSLTKTTLNLEGAVSHEHMKKVAGLFLYIQSVVQQTPTDRALALEKNRLLIASAFTDKNVTEYFKTARFHLSPKVRCQYFFN